MGLWFGLFPLLKIKPIKSCPCSLCTQKTLKKCGGIFSVIYNRTFEIEKIGLNEARQIFDNKFFVYGFEYQLTKYIVKDSSHMQFLQELCSF